MAMGYPVRAALQSPVASLSPPGCSLCLCE
jgi:hypothetical protein